MSETWKTLKPYALITPQTLVFLLFLVFPILMIGVVSFWEFNGYSMTPAFTLANYQGTLTDVTFKTYLNTFKFLGMVWLATLLIGYPVAYFLAFHVPKLEWQILLFLVCTIPFWTSNIIRMISWVPLLGREGLVNQMFMGVGLIQQPMEFLLYSDFAVVLGMVHLYIIFMIAPIFNSLMRIERSLVTAAEDLGASGLQVFKEVILPLSAPGIAIGSIFIVTLVMGEFVTVRLMGGGQSASVGKLIQTQIGSLQYPLAAANAIVLLVVTMLIIISILRVLDIRKEL
ncbi:MULTISPECIES: ABC transporter permease [Cyanophyceae]|uniref:ABC transporter permease n=1 Tax=Cyanophyceae TaxID=3028117 RepID=UPI0016833B85|nr:MULTISPECIES: ABC transporter permease [Cyanophyceae]MBD1919143.1 ABC transporter permease [Phormidium sp. FACHB-77]MBD2029001.1 ABC transporter permease [Phormidium sp. FACHB-322]MBD2054116.1 ABC transporter permease [Leptolyngbya sp. FACHB-60]